MGIHPSNFMSKEEMDRVYLKRCHVCGKFVKREEWERKDNPGGYVPMCDECVSNICTGTMGY